jgi:hypothetical protein
MACLGSDSNYQSPLLPQGQTMAEWAGILTDQRLWPGQPVLVDLRFVQMTAFQSAETSLLPWFPAETVLPLADQAIGTNRPLVNLLVLTGGRFLHVP